MTELLCLFGPFRWFSKHHTQIENLDIWKRAHKEEKGVIILSSDVGNWAAGLNGVDLLIVTKRLKPAWLHRAVERARTSCGVKGTYEPKTFSDVLDHLKRNGTVGFVLDQYAGPPVGMRVPFFNTPVSTSTALATLARRTGAPVLPVVSHREPDGTYKIEVRPAIHWQGNGQSPQRELAEQTARYVQKMEQDVRAHPEQWLWTHRRFKGDLSPLRADEWDKRRRRLD